MKIKKVVITHNATVIPYARTVFSSFGATKNGKLRLHLAKFVRGEDGRYQPENHYVEYDMSNMLEGVNYKHAPGNHEKLIEGAIFRGDVLNIDVHDYQNTFREFTITDLIDDFKYVIDTDNETERPAELTHTAIFPPVETKAEWVDRMERILSHCAQNFESAMASIYPQHYTRLHDAPTAKPSTDYLVRQTNTSVHCRWQIGWLWWLVDRQKRNLSTTYTQAKLETMVQGLYENMRTPQHIKQFFHRHNTQEWSKLRNQSASTGENKRHISLWDTDYTEGTLLADLTARSTFSGVVHERSADASMFAYGVTEFTKAAKHPNWERITERIY